MPSSWRLRLTPRRHIHNTRANHCILLERPLTKGEMRANVLWRARRWAGQKIRGVTVVVSLAPTHMRVGACRPPGRGAAWPRERARCFLSRVILFLGPLHLFH